MRDVWVCFGGNVGGSASFAGGMVGNYGMVCYVNMLCCGVLVFAKSSILLRIIMG